MTRWAILLFLLCSATVDFTEQRDSSYAPTIRIPATNRVVYTYRLVSLAWLRYLQSTDTPHIWLYVSSLPVTWNQLHLATANREMTADATAEISLVARNVILYYIRVMKSSCRPVIHTNGLVDQAGIFLDYYHLGDNETIDTRFNRTIEISFETPPYGQSRPNRLVTNRDVSWHNLRHIRYFRSNRGTTIDKTDLLYRYYHNVGHLLGFGHFLGGENETDLDRRIYTDEQLRALFVARSIDVKSVMYANTSDHTMSSSTPTALDRSVLRYMFENLDALLSYSVRYVVAGPMAKSLVSNLRDFAGFFADE